jgi:DNA-binding CsgD family transcriptional regulator
MVVDLVAPVRGSGWTLLRDGRDFDDNDVAFAGQLLPLLTAMERLYRRLPIADSLGTADDLTARELQLVRLLSTGLTAESMARRLGISPSTVRKHLEHAYAKLDAHDRVIAVNKARARGLVPG